MTPRAAAPTHGPARPRWSTATRHDLLDVVRAAAAGLALLSPLLPGVVPGLLGVVVFFAVSGHVAAHAVVEEDKAVRSWPWRRPRGSLVTPVLLLVLAAYAASVVVGVGLAVLARLPLLPFLPLPVLSSLWLVVPLVLLVGRDAGRARVALGMAGVAAVLGTLAWLVPGAGGGLPLVHASWAWCFLLGAALCAAEAHRARLPR